MRDLHVAFGWVVIASNGLAGAWARYGPKR